MWRNNDSCAKTTLMDYAHRARGDSARLLPPPHTGHSRHTMSAIPPVHTPRYDVIDSLYR
jgi:hypothetical protein